MSQPLALHPDRALPADPEVREIARRLYAATAELPLVCMHGHVEAADPRRRRAVRRPRAACW